MEAYPGIKQLGEKVLTYINWAHNVNGECTHNELRDRFKGFTVLDVCEYLAKQGKITFGTNDKFEVIFIPII